jgi:3alpha(or 20beta)-hydroxysteroid dehydrogenase
LQDRVALISGGTRAVANAQADLLSARGVKLVIGNADLERAAALADAFGKSAIHVSLDPTCPRDWANAVTIADSQFGSPAILINAGILRSGLVPELPRNILHDLLEAYMAAGILGLRAVAPAMKKQGFGTIVNVGLAASYMEESILFATPSARRTLVGLTHAGALELAGSTVRINGVLAGEERSVRFGNTPNQAMTAARGTTRAEEELGIFSARLADGDFDAPTGAVFRPDGSFLSGLVDQGPAAI